MKNTFWLQTPEPEEEPSFADGVRYWAAILFVVATFMVWNAPASDTEADQAVASDKAQAPIDAAMVAFGTNVLEVWP